MKKVVKKEEVIPELEDFVIVDEKLYYCSGRYNGLFCKDMKTEQIHFLGLFPCEELNAKRLYAKLVYSQGKIVFIPCNAKSIATYEITSNKFETINIGQDAVGYKYWGNVLYNNQVYMFPMFGKAVLCFDIETKNVEVIEAYSELIEWQREKGEWAFTNACCYKGKMYAPLYKRNLLTEYDFVTKQMRLIKMGEIDEALGCICCDDNNLYMALHEKSEILCWNPLNNLKKRISYEGYLGPECFSWGMTLVTIGICDKRLYVQPFIESRELQITIETGEENVMKEIETGSDVTEMIIKDGRICLLQGMGERLVKMCDGRSGKVEVIPLDCEEADVKRLQYLLKKDIVYETEEMSLEKFCRTLK